MFLYLLIFNSSIISTSFASEVKIITTGHSQCAPILQELSNLGVSITKLHDLNLGIQEHRDAIAQVVDKKPERWHLIKKHHPELVAPLEPVLFVDLEETGPLAGMKSEVINLALKNMGGLQLETQCCVQCPWCGFSINKKGKYQQTPVTVVRTILKRLAAINTAGAITSTHHISPPSLQMLYYESDPFDYRMPLEPNSSVTYYYPEIHLMARNYARSKPYVSTAIPKGKEAKVLEFIDRGLHYRTQLRLSYSDHNSERLHAIDPKTGKSFDDEITERFKVILSDQIQKLTMYENDVSKWSERVLANETKNIKTLIDQNNFNFFLKRDPRNTQKDLLTLRDINWIYNLASLKDHELHLTLSNEKIIAEVRRILAASYLVIYINSFFKEGSLYIHDIKIRSIGRAFESSEDRIGIGCFDGVLLTPTHAYNLVQLPGPTAEFKDGQVVVELSKKQPEGLIPDIASIQEVLRYGIVTFQGTNSLLSLTPEQRNSFILIDYQGNKHRYSFYKIGQGYEAKRTHTYTNPVPLF